MRTFNALLFLVSFISLLVDASPIETSLPSIAAPTIAARLKRVGGTMCFLKAKRQDGDSDTDPYRPGPPGNGVYC